MNNIYNQDNSRTFTNEQLIRKYGLENLSKDRKAIENQKTALTRIESDQSMILKSIIINLNDTIENQSDISLWFFDGIPTIENSPADTFVNMEDHLGDVYYDKTSGFVYIFKKIGNSYLWSRSEDASLIQAMSLSNSALDSYDNVRNVFFGTPIPPYSNGDWLLTADGNLYICQISKAAHEQYDVNDFIIASKYTDDTKANKLAGTLTIVSGQVTTIIQNLDIIQQNIEDNRYYEDENGEKHLISTTTSQLTQSLKSLQALFQITGGNNLIKNSVGLFGDDYWIKSSEGVFGFGEDNNLIGITTSASKISVSNGSITSSISNITNLTIDTIKSFSYKIRQDEDTTTTIKLYGLDLTTPIYEKTFNESMDWQEIYDEESCRFFVDNSNLTLVIESSSIYDGKVDISDLILNDGEKQKWQPSQGELFGTIVKMSQLGISCYSIEGGFVTMMTTQGFQIRELHGSDIGNVISKFTKDGMETLELLLRGRMTQRNMVKDIITFHGHETYIDYIKGSDT